MSSYSPPSIAAVCWSRTSRSWEIRFLAVLAAGLLYIRTREEDSSIRSMALSGRKRSVTYLDDRVTAASRASSEIFRRWCSS
jgi:hypothetical protein